MSLPRNPFRSMRVESLESHDLFLKLFQPLAIGALGQDPWSAVQLIRSAQGGGKTSLLRVFTPESLSRIADGASEHFTDIREAIREVGAFSDGEPNTLGVYVPLGSTPYATISRSQVGEQDPLHVFYALLDCRTILTALRGLVTLSGRDQQGDLSRISFRWPPDEPNPLFEYSSPVELQTWARQTEREIWRAIDRGELGSVAHLGHARPYSFEALSANNLLVDGKPICTRVVVMVDDAHKLAPDQRARLLEHVITARLGVSFWAAERMYAMQRYELLAPDTSSSAREYNQVVLSMWLQKATDTSTSKFYNQVANKRMQEIGRQEPFERVAVENIEDPRTLSHIETATGELIAKLKLAMQEDLRLPRLSLERPQRATPLDYLIHLKTLDLYLGSAKGHVQGTLDFEASIAQPASEVLSGSRAVAEYQVCTKASLPYYYGAKTIHRVASWNVDQFLSLAGGIFDQLDAQVVRGAGTRIEPAMQERVLRTVASAYWDGLPRRMPGGETMQRFLRAFVKYAWTESLGSTAKYPPGVTGIGITSRDHDRMRNSSELQDGHLSEFASLLSDAVAHNVLFMRADSKQGKKGETVTVFYLNRLLCVFLQLPVGLGGYWKRKVDHFASLLTVDKAGNGGSALPSLFDYTEATL